MSQLFRKTLRKSSKIIIPTTRKQFMFTCVHCYQLNPFPLWRIQRKVRVHGLQGVSFAGTMHVSLWCRSTLNISTSPLPIMHRVKGNTHFIYLEETRGGSSQPEERRGNKTKAKGREKCLCLNIPH